MTLVHLLRGSASEVAGVLADALQRAPENLNGQAGCRGTRAGTKSVLYNVRLLSPMHCVTQLVRVMSRTCA